MKVPSISDAEYRLCLFVWEGEPISSGELAKRCTATYGWARTTTHTLIRRLVDRGVLKNDNGTVTSLFSKETAQDIALSELFMLRFEGSAQELYSAVARLNLTNE